jgi:exopolyphosphatase / guanosine-5'-triphosphate,3'-diphosphate pyrophosphatase
LAATRAKAIRKMTPKRPTGNAARSRPARRPARNARRTVDPAPPTARAPGYSLLAVIDVGSRSLRLAIGEAAPGRPLRRLETLEAPVAIGVDTFSKGRISAATTEAVVKTLADFLLVLESFRIPRADCRIVATTAVRDARNRDVFLDRVEQECGLRIEVIEPIEETRLVHQLVRHLLGPRFEEGASMLLSLGAGGTQLIVQEDGEIVLGETQHFGMLQLREARPSEREAAAAARTFLSKVVRSIRRVHDLSRVTSLVVICKELFHLLETAAAVELTGAGLEVGLDELVRLRSELSTSTTDQLVSRTGLDYPTAEMGRMALEEMLAFAVVTSATAVTVPSASMLDSLLLDASLVLEDPPRPVAAGAPRGLGTLAQQIESAALALGRKYRFDEDHSINVRALALELFDGLRSLTHLREASRLRLGVAALLHDIGYFVSHEAHETHGSYLIAHSEILGLSRPERERIAHIARRHRRQMGGGHDDLAMLPAPERMEILKLAAILRLADALDDDHRQRVHRVRVRLGSDVLRVFAETRGGAKEDFTTVAQTFAEKADLFEEVFGLDPVLSEVLAPPA